MTLFKNIADIRTIYPDLESDSIWDSIRPYLEEGAELYMYQYISKEFYNELVTALGATNPTYTLTDLSAAQQAVVHHLRRAQWYFGQYLGLDSSITQFSSRGPREAQEDGSSQPRQWVFNLSKEATINKADQFLDKALEVLEKAPGSYATWQSSDAFTLHHRYLLSIVKDFPELGNSRRTFKSLMPFIDQAEERYVEPSIGPDLLADLKTKLQTAATLTSYETKLVDYLRKAVRNYSLYLGAHQLRLKLTDQGFQVASTDAGIGKYDVADREDYSDLLSKKLQNGDYYMQQAKNYLEVNAAQFSTYNNSAYHKNKQPTSKITDQIDTDASSVMI